MQTQGFSLLETVIYIGLLAIVLPGLVLLLLMVSQRHAGVDYRNRAEQQAAQIFHTIQTDLLEASAVDISQSQLNVASSSLVYVKGDGTEVTLDNPTVSVMIGGEEREISQLRYLYSKEGTSAWLSDYRSDIRNWNIQPVRDSEGTLSGLVFALSITVLESDGVLFQSSAFNAQTTIALPSTVSEL